MKYEPRKVFILVNNNYKEVTYREFCECKESDITYTNKCFIPIQGMLLEVDEKTYRDFYRDKERNRYLRKLDLTNKLLSIDAFDNDDGNGIDFVEDFSEDVSEIVSHKLMMDKLKSCILLLSDEEKKLVYQHYFEEITEIELSKLYGISQQAISKRLKKVREKLKQLMEK